MTNKLLTSIWFAIIEKIHALADISERPLIIVNVIVNEEHHYHKGAVHDDKSTHITLK